MVTDRILAQMEQGIIPWRKPWKTFGAFSESECAISYVSRRPYSLLNQWLLGRLGEWMTFKQMAERGGRLKEGAKSRFVVFYQMLHKEDKEHLDDNGNPKIINIPLLNRYPKDQEASVLGWKNPIKPKIRGIRPNNKALKKKDFSKVDFDSQCY